MTGYLYDDCGRAVQVEVAFPVPSPAAVRLLDAARLGDRYHAAGTTATTTRHVFVGDGHSCAECGGFDGDDRCPRCDGTGLEPATCECCEALATAIVDDWGLGFCADHLPPDTEEEIHAR